MATAQEEKDEQSFFAQKLKEQEQDERKHTMAHETQAEKEGRAIPKEKRMTHREAIEELSDLIGTTAPVVEADSLRKQLSTVGDPDTELAPEMEAAVEDMKNRAKDSKSKEKK